MPQALFYFWSVPKLVRKSLTLALYLVTVNAWDLIFDVWKPNLLRIYFLLQVSVISVVTLKNGHFISRHLLHICSFCWSAFWSSYCVVKVIHLLCSLPKFVVLTCQFRRQKDSRKSPVTSKVTLVVAFDDITSTAEHLTASAIWIILTSLLSSPTIFLFCRASERQMGNTVSSWSLF